MGPMLALRKSLRRTGTLIRVVGIPYQNRFVNETSLKIKFNDENKSLINGNRWYKIQAYRALNQALGRCIRHKNDWGAVILLDSRFSNRDVQDNLPNWIQQQLQNYQSWDTYLKNLTAFCKRMQQSNEPKSSLL
ncbi:Fanconi anemia group J protein [Homalodisca vitripennis]|nr:Fanconi anemia group J protein [Homalodisca vitripennis]